MDRFKQIETFVRVAEAGSLAAAALEEGVSPVEGASTRSKSASA
jgi:DNA-binding transcriptional LysR family regulator